MVKHWSRIERRKSRLFALDAHYILMILLLALCVACGDPDSWIPKGEVSFLQLREVSESEDLKSAIIDYRIANLGLSSIAKTTFSLCLSTDAEKYYLSLEIERSIPADSLIYGSIELRYRNAAETATLQGLSLDSFFFE